jgi:hypothetical protein
MVIRIAEFNQPPQRAWLDGEVRVLGFWSASLAKSQWGLRARPISEAAAVIRRKIQRKEW